MYIEKRNPSQLPENAQFHRFSSRDISGTLIEIEEKNFSSVHRTPLITSPSLAWKLKLNNNFLKSITVSESKTLHTVCIVESTQFLTVLAQSVRNSHLTGFPLTKHRKSFLDFKGSTARLYNCSHRLSPLHIADECFDKIPIKEFDTVLYVIPVSRQTL